MLTNFSRYDRIADVSDVLAGHCPFDWGGRLECACGAMFTRGMDADIQNWAIHAAEAVVDSVSGAGGLEDEFDDDVLLVELRQLRGELEGFRVGLEIEEGRSEALRRQLDVVEQERRSLVVRLESLEREVST